MTEYPQYGDGVKTPAEIHSERLADPQAAPIEVEVAQEVGPQPVKTVSVALPTGVAVAVPMESEWRRSAAEAAQTGDFLMWAELVLADEDFAVWEEWWETDPKMGDVLAFFRAVGKATGMAAGGNRALRRASDRMQRR